MESQTKTNSFFGGRVFETVILGNYIEFVLNTHMTLN